MSVSWPDKPPATREDFRRVIEQVLNTSPVIDYQHLFKDLTTTQTELAQLNDELRVKSGNPKVPDTINEKILAGLDPTIGEILDICIQNAGPSIT